ncbi:hypothetical protein [Streptomyces sp. NPDC005955]|uniref:hypothetical protein n=1 Tax=Streptomyces sp. NPDC005955 TaxID=3364738 RepID=UPI00367D9B13
MADPRSSERPRGWVPPRKLLAFLMLLGAVFTASYAVGSVVGPVAPWVHSDDSGTHDEEPAGSGGVETGPGGGDPYGEVPTPTDDGSDPYGDPHSGGH